MHVLVIGGNRFVGRFLGWRLLAAGHRVTLLNRGRLPDPFGQRVERLIGDRTTDLERLVARRTFDAVVDLAAFTGQDGQQVVSLLRGRTDHYLMISTGQVYLVREGCPRPAREEDYPGPLMERPANPADLADWEYGIGKRACEDALAAADGLPATRIRIPVVNGPLDYQRRMEGYLWRLVDGEPLLLPEGGPQRLRHVAAGEVARFLVEILGRAETFGRAFNLAQEESPTLAELLAMLRQLIGSRSELLAVPSERLRAAGLNPVAVSPFSGRWISLLDPSCATRELGFRHAPLERVLAEIVSSFLAHTPADQPPGYAGRPLELQLANHLRHR